MSQDSNSVWVCEPCTIADNKHKEFVERFNKKHHEDDYDRAMKGIA